MSDRKENPHGKLAPLPHTAQNRCFGCGPANPVGLHLEFMLAEDGTVVCLASVPDTFEGPRGFVHGGIIATLLDETMSKAVRSHNVVGMTRHMEVDYNSPVPSCGHAYPPRGSRLSSRRPQALGRGQHPQRRRQGSRTQQGALHRGPSPPRAGCSQR